MSYCFGVVTLSWSSVGRIFFLFNKAAVGYELLCCSGSVGKIEKETSWLQKWISSQFNFPKISFQIEVA